MRILLVDDDARFRATLWRLLAREGRGVQVEEAADGEEAVRLVANRRPDVVLMDLTMPRMNGVEATRRLKTRWPDLPVIALTVHDDPVYERTAQAAGADRFLLKKTAGTALWPALVALVPPSGSARHDRALIPSYPCAAVRPRRRPAPGSEKSPLGRSGVPRLGGPACSRYRRSADGDRIRPDGPLPTGDE